MREFDPRCVPQSRSAVRFPDVMGPVDLELGCGAGYHPIHYAKRYPERTLIAIERTQTRFSRFEGRLAGHPEITNIVPVNDDAVRWVTHCVPQQSIERVFLLYPNPYPKKSQANKRWHRMPFMGRLLDSLQPGGILTLSTNMGFYAEEAESYMVDTWQMRHLKTSSITLQERSGKEARTHFERKYLERGETCFELVFERP